MVTTSIKYSPLKLVMDILSEKNIFLYLFFVVYFGFQIFSQMWGKYLSTGIPNSKSYLQNFVNALVLIAVVLYFSNPSIPLTKSTIIIVFVTFIFMLLPTNGSKRLQLLGLSWSPFFFPSIISRSLKRSFRPSGLIG